MAPEILRNQKQYTDRCDVYSFAVIMYELLFELRPFSSVRRVTQTSAEDEDDMDDISSMFNLGFAVMKGRRPNIPEIALSDLEQQYVSLMISCWDQDPNQRPSFVDIFQAMERFES
jgi:serine/threonine protein kinase